MTVKDIHSLLAKALEFPEYYGCNWDAFDECIADDSVCNPPRKLVIKGWDIFLREHESEAMKFWSCLSDRPATQKKPMEILTSPRACACCGYLTLEDWNPGSFEICEVCNWEDDGVQFNEPSYQGGANINSLKEAQSKFLSRNRIVSKVKDFRWVQHS